MTPRKPPMSRLQLKRDYSTPFTLSARTMSDTAPSQETRDFRDTVFLPKTDFPMKAGLPQKEPAILARWLESDLEGQIRESRKDRAQFILHDGPPYANGDMHIGHALNHILRSEEHTSELQSLMRIS